jgi:hypothetical protein
MGDGPELGKLRPCKTVFSTDASQSFSFSVKGAVLWDTATARPLRIVETLPVGAATFSRDGKQVFYFVFEKNTLRGLRLDNGRQWDIDLGDWSMVTKLCVSADNKTLLVGHYRGGVRALDLNALNWRWEAEDHPHAVRNLSITDDGRTAMSCSIDGLVLIWDVASGRHIHSLTVGRDIRAAVMTPDGARFLSATGDGKVSRLWDFTRLNGFRPPQKALNEAWARLRENPNDLQAAMVCGKWYSDMDCFDWAKRTLDSAANESDPRASAEIIAAQSLWVSGQNSDAVQVFNTLRKRSPDPQYEQYLALCAFAAGREAQP